MENNSNREIEMDEQVVATEEQVQVEIPETVYEDQVPAEVPEIEAVDQEPVVIPELPDVEASPEGEYTDVESQIAPEEEAIEEVPANLVGAQPPEVAAGRRRRLAHNLEEFQKGFKRMTGKDIKIPITREQMMKGKVGRNDKCPCGSGKKFKACCLMVRQQPWRG